jgi:hypothetical protein
MTSFALMICGIIALVGGFTMIPAAPASAMPALQPSPRPTLQPTADVNQHDWKPTPVVMGRLTGTVIDLRTGAPAAGVTVSIGDTTVVSDSNGNYDSWLASGYYRLSLELRSDQGLPGTPAQQVAVGPGDTVVVHLFFTSPAPALPAAQVAAATPVAAAPAALPPSLPDTSVAPPLAGHHAISDGTLAPQLLPHTAAPLETGSPGTWLLLGAMMLGLGGLIQLLPRRAPRRRPASTPEALLSDLLSSDLTSDDAGMLAELLDREL